MGMLLLAVIAGAVDWCNAAALEEERMKQEEKNKREQERQRAEGKCCIKKCVGTVLAAGIINGAVLLGSKLHGA